MNAVEFSLPAVRGFQGRRAIYTALLQVRMLPRLFPHASRDSRRSPQQTIAKQIQHWAQEIANGQRDFHLPAVTVSVEQKVRFAASETSDSKSPACGQLHILLDAPLTILDGEELIQTLQHAVKQLPAIANESIPIVFHVDPSGSRRGRLLSDLRRHDRTTAPSQRIAFDEHDDLARLTRELIAAVPVFVDAIELEKTAISNRSRKLFTLSALYQANRTLLADQKGRPYQQQLALATAFWTEVAAQIPGWSEVVSGQDSPADIRANYVHCHAIGIAAIARAGRTLLKQSPDAWKKRLKRLASLDWSRSNTKLWEGRAMIGGRLSKSSSAVARAGNAVKLHLGLKFSAEEQAMEA